MANDEIDVRFDSDGRRFEVFLDGLKAGHVRFRDEAGVRTFVHTQIDPEFEGKGLGGELIRAAFDQTRAAGLRVIPECPFVKSFIEKHPEYGELVAAA
jgi:predicted GNAT family acetyltransferase